MIHVALRLAACSALVMQSTGRARMAQGNETALQVRTAAAAIGEIE
jgi:hypothetical protein